MTPHRYHLTLRVLHCLIATLTIAALFLGTFVMARQHHTDPNKSFVLLKHMLAGSFLLILTLLRLIIRPRTKRPPPLFSGITVADLMVPYVHRIFDILVLIMVGSGIGIAVLSGLPGIVLGGEVLPESFSILPVHTLHVVTARILAGFVALHVCGALYHQFILRDGLLSRMSLALERRR